MDKIFRHFTLYKRWKYDGKTKWKFLCQVAFNKGQPDTMCWHADIDVKYNSFSVAIVTQTKIQNVQRDTFMISYMNPFYKYWLIFLFKYIGQAGKTSFIQK